MSKRNNIKTKKVEPVIEEKRSFGIFKRSDLLTYSEFKVLLDDEEFPNSKAEAIGAKLAKYAIYNHENLYIINEHNIYEISESKTVINRKLGTLVTKMIEASYKALQVDQQDTSNNARHLKE